MADFREDDRQPHSLGVGKALPVFPTINPFQTQWDVYSLQGGAKVSCFIH